MNKQKITPRILKGFRDFFPEQTRQRQYVIEIIRRTFELWGFSPIETPAIEYLKVFTGNIGEDEKLFYKFKDEGGREVALRYDQTVPTCRFIAQYYNQLIFPYKRYQIQTVWRAEKPQKGRFREFIQCDADIFGLKNPESDAETIALTIDIFQKLGFKRPKALINDRDLFKGIPYKAIVAIDKLGKIGEVGVIAELTAKGYPAKEAKTILDKVRNNKPNTNLQAIFEYLSNYGFGQNYEFWPTLARSFSYSNGTIWEIVVEEWDAGSLAGCERYDSLVGRFIDKEVPGVGFAIGFDRTVEAMAELKLFPEFKSVAKALVAVFGQAALKQALEFTKRMREAGINTEIYSDPEAKLDKQLKYADKKQIPYVLILGEQELKEDCVTVKDLRTREQQKVPAADLVAYIKTK